MTRLWLVRHAEAEGNRYRRIQGWYDAPLTRFGIRQLLPLQERFAALPLDAVYSSDLARAKQTAAAVIGARALELQLRPGLREQHMGDWEDQCWGWASYTQPEQYAALNRSPEDFTVPGSENYSTVLNRVLGTLGQICEENPGKTVAAVSHGCAVRIVLAHLLGYPPEETGRVPHCDNTAVAELQYENGQFTVLRYNDNSHLPPELSAFSRETWWQQEDWKDGRDLYFRPMDVFSEAGGQLYLRRYRDTWIASHGSDEGFCDVYLSNARHSAMKDPWTVTEVMQEGSSCGLLQLSPHQMEDEGAGHISLLFLEPEYRGKGLGTQLIGQALSYYRKKNRKHLSLRVADTNEAALNFYLREGFRIVCTEEATVGESYLMVRGLEERA